MLLINNNSIHTILYNELLNEYMKKTTLYIITIEDLLSGVYIL